MRYLGLFVLLCGFLTSATTRVTLYQGGFAYVEEERVLALQGEKVAVIFGLPATVIPESLSWEGIDVLNWQLVMPQVGLESLIGKEVLVSYAGRTARGTLVSLQGGLILQTQEGYLFIPQYESVFSSAQPDLTGLPDLKLHLSAAPETEKIVLRYLVRDLSWEAAYIGIYSGDKLSLWGNAVLRNRCGVDFYGVKVDLVAGEVFGPKEAGAFRTEVKALAVAPAPEVSPVAEYHRYSLPGTVDIPQGETVVEYLPETQVKVEEVYRFAYGSILFVLRFTNTTGLPLPAGIIRVFGEGAFLGQGEIGHTPLDKEVELSLGVAFDLTGERIQTEYTRLAKDRYREGYRILVHSAKEKPVTVEVIEEMRGEWRILHSSLPYEVLDAHRVLFRLPVPPQGEAAVEYTVEYTY